MSPKWKLEKPISQASLQLLPGVAETQAPLTGKEVLPRTHFSGKYSVRGIGFHLEVGWGEYVVVVGRSSA